ncbi:MAG: hypothetical protein U1E37_05070 [Sphingomonadaceae bacterium]
MNAYSTLIPAEDGERPGFGQTAASAMSLKWSALHDAAGVAAMLAGITVESSGPEVRDFPAAVRKAAGWRRDRAEQGIEDLTAILEPALAALMAVNARGANPAVPALALWQEFRAARDALLALVPPREGR